MARQSHFPSRRRVFEFFGAREESVERFRSTSLSIDRQAAEALVAYRKLQAANRAAIEAWYEEQRRRRKAGENLNEGDAALGQKSKANVLMAWKSESANSRRLLRKIVKAWRFTAHDIRTDRLAWQMEQLQKKGKFSHPRFVNPHTHMSFLSTEADPRFPAPGDYEVRPSSIAISHRAPAYSMRPKTPNDSHWTQFDRDCYTPGPGKYNLYEKECYNPQPKSGTSHTPAQSFGNSKHTRLEKEVRNKGKVLQAELPRYARKEPLISKEHVARAYPARFSPGPIYDAPAVDPGKFPTYPKHAFPKGPRF